MDKGYNLGCPLVMSSFLLIGQQAYPPNRNFSGVDHFRMCVYFCLVSMFGIALRNAGRTHELEQHLSWFREFLHPSSRSLEHSAVLSHYLLLTGDAFPKKWTPLVVRRDIFV